MAQKTIIMLNEVNRHCMSGRMCNMMAVEYTLNPSWYHVSFTVSWLLCQILDNACYLLHTLGLGTDILP